MSVTTTAQHNALKAELTLKHPTAVFDESNYGYLRLTEARPDNMLYQRIANAYFRDVAKRHNMCFDGYDEQGFPCFMHEAD